MKKRPLLSCWILLIVFLATLFCSPWNKFDWIRSPISEHTKVIWLYTPYKVGSTTFYNQLLLNYGFNGTWMNIINKGIGLHGFDNCDRVVFREHNTNNWTWFLHHPADFCVTLVRRPLDLFPSAYFQDIDKKNYPYYFGTRTNVTRSLPEELVSHFMKFDFSQFRYVNIERYFEEFKNYTGVDLWATEFDKRKGYNILKLNKTRYCRNMVVATMETIAQTSKLKRLMREMGFGESSGKSVFRNKASEKWYGLIYKLFKYFLPEEYYERYGNIQRRIETKFYNSEKSIKQMKGETW